VIQFSVRDFLYSYKATLIMQPYSSFQLSFLANQGAGNDTAEVHEKPRKNGLVEMEEKITERRQCDKMDGEVWSVHKPIQMSTQRTESSADSDYSFESHASSSVESRSPRELEEGCDVFLELPHWCKRNPASATATAYTRHSPSSSINHSPDDVRDGAEALSTTCATSPSLEHIAAVSTGINHTINFTKSSEND
jgi:hypothetical protein